MPKVWLVAWREFRQTVMRPVFIIAILGIPILMVGLGGLAIAILVTHKEPPLVGTVAVVDSTGRIAEATKIEFSDEEMKADADEAMREQVEQMEERLTTGQAMTTPSQIPTLARGEVKIAIDHRTATTEQTIQSLIDQVDSGELLALAIFPPELLDRPDAGSDDPGRFRLVVADTLGSEHVSMLEDRLGQAVVRARIEAVGQRPEDVMALLRKPRTTTEQAISGGGVASASQGLREIRSQLIPMVFMILIWVGVFSSAQHLMMSTIEEKSNRVMEVLLSAVSPLQLMTGKILGYGAVGLLVVGIYTSLGLGALGFLERASLVHWSDIVYLGIFYLMAYFMIASLMAAVGSAVSDIREANTLITPVMLILFIPWFLWMPITQAPNGLVATLCSFIPPASPFAMILRVSAEEPVPFWQIPVSIVWGYLCVGFMVWGAAKIFRIGVLMTGKPPSPLELLKWLRYN